MAPGTLGVVVVVVILSLVTLSYEATVPVSKDSILTSTAKIFTTTERQTSRSSITTKSGSTETLLVKGAQNETEVKADERAEIPLKRLHNIVHGIHLVALNFEHVKYPLVFTLVVIFAGLSKICKYHLIDLLCFILANSLDPDQTPQNAASDQGLYCFPLHQLFSFRRTNMDNNELVQILGLVGKELRCPSI